MFTRCPHCQTTFRITSEALEMAGGQVRCGRCTQVFDARAELTEELPQPARRDEAEPAAAQPETPAPPAPRPARERAPSEPAGEDDVVFLPEDWRVDTSERRPRHTGAWAAAAAVAALALTGQLVHDFRGHLAGRDGVGAIVQRAYGLLGIEVVPRFDPDDYRIRDWVATAAQRGEGRSSLVIRAEIENRAMQPLPQPHIHLELKDRWDSVVASRVFEPDDYLPAARAGGPLRAGATTIAELEIVDPGPDAYGFELDVCVRANTGVRCASDDVFR